jgi:hypothetical protein
MRRGAPAIGNISVSPVVVLWQAGIDSARSTNHGTARVPRAAMRCGARLPDRPHHDSRERTRLVDDLARLIPQPQPRTTDQHSRNVTVQGGQKLH